MQPSSFRADPNNQPPHPTQFAAELPSQWQGGSAVSGPINTQFRHELPGQLGQTINQTPPTWRRFAIATDNDSLTSGFPYQHRLQDFGILPDQWYAFTNEVITAAKLTLSEDYAAWGTGIAAGTAASPFLLVFGPVVGYYSGKAVHKKTVVKRVKEKLAQEGELRTVLRRWNDGVFQGRGMQAWLEPPSESGEVLVEIAPGMKQRDVEKAAKKQARRFTIVIMPHDHRNKPMTQWSTQTSPITPQSSVQSPWISQNGVRPHFGTNPMKYPASEETKHQARTSPGAPRGNGLGQAQEMPAGATDLPSAYELDAVEVSHASR